MYRCPYCIVHVHSVCVWIRCFNCFMGRSCLGKCHTLLHLSLLHKINCASQVYIFCITMYCFLYIVCAWWMPWETRHSFTTRSRLFSCRKKLKKLVSIGDFSKKLPAWSCHYRILICHCNSAPIYMSVFSRRGRLSNNYSVLCMHIIYKVTVVILD